MQAQPEELEQLISYRFCDRQILERALTHRSRAHEAAVASPSPGLHNEQLEFLGDAVLGFLVSEELVRLHPDEPEGRLSKMRSHLVSAAYLQNVARNVGLGTHLLLGKGEELSGGRTKKTLLVDGLEALIAAIYLDGGVEPARAFILRFVIAGVLDDSAFFAQPSPHDYKSALQEWAQAQKFPPPRYVLVREHGPEHAKTFTVEARLGRDYAARAEGVSKKAAAQAAAQNLLAQITESRIPAES